MSKSQLVIVGFLGVLVLVVVLIFLGVLPGLKKPPDEAIPKTELSFWGFNSDAEGWSAVISRYEALNPTVKVNYRSILEGDYERALLDALAAGEGPDVLLIRNDWLFKHKNKLSPAPSQLITPEFVLESFPKVVTDDFVSRDGIWALPVSIKTLALAYNRDMFDAKQISFAPENWDRIKSAIPRLRELQGNFISKSAISVGGSEAVVRNAADVLMLLFMQNGSLVLKSDPFTAVFDNRESQLALDFYRSFSDPKSPHYTVNETLKNSIESFADAHTAMVFVYPEDLYRIRTINPGINLRLVSMPQLRPESPVNIARYWGVGVSRQTSKQVLAWDFIKFATTSLENASAYVAGTFAGVVSPPALRSLIGNYSEHPTLRVFAPQILNAKNPTAAEGDKVREIINDMIKSALSRQASTNELIREAAGRVSLLFIGR